MKTVIIRLGGNAPAAVSWLEQGGGGGVGHGSLAEASRACQGAKVLVLVPASDVLLTQATVPGRNRSRAIQAAPYALEESLAEDLDKLHFAYAPRNSDGSMAVAVVNKRAMAHWLALFQEVALEVEVLIAETMAVPFQEGSWSLLIDGEVALLRTAPQAGVAVDLVNLKAVLTAESSLVGEAGRRPLLVYLAKDEQRSLPLDWPLPPTVKKGELLTFFAAGVDRGSGIDLLQGEYRRHTNWEQLWSRWQRPILCGVALLLLQAVGFGLDYFQLQRQGLELKRQIETVYRTTFPEAKQVVNPRAQMEQKLASLTVGQEVEGGLLKVLSQVGPELQKTEGATLQRLRYRDKVTQLELTLPNLAAGESLQGRLAKLGGLSVELRTGTAAKEEVVAHFEIKEKNP